MTAPKRPSTADVVATVAMLTVAAMTASLSLLISFFFAMVTDACGDNRNTAALDWIYPVTWGGIAIGSVPHH